MYILYQQTLEQWSTEYDSEGLGKFHAILCDPPYGISFMGRKWDEQVEAKAWGEALMPHLYPGALVMMFGGTRTWHRLAVGMEDAGFECFDTIMWVYATGFPKAQDISKLIDKANGDKRKVVGTKVGLPGYSLKHQGVGGVLSGRKDGSLDNSEGECAITAAGSAESSPWSGHKTTALKPSWEPILCFKKPLDGTYADVAMKYGSGALNVDGGRIGVRDRTEYGLKNSKRSKQNCYGNPSESADFDSSLGRYPTNLCFDEEAAAQLDAMTGPLTSGKMRSGVVRSNVKGWAGPMPDKTGSETIGDSGGASRFFYCSKASTSERNAGLDGRNTHPTVKPIALARWLATLLLPPSSVGERRLLVPFSGSGSEMIGALQAGWDTIVGIERPPEPGEPDYCEIAQARLEHWDAQSNV